MFAHSTQTNTHSLIHTYAEKTTVGVAGLLDGWKRKKSDKEAERDRCMQIHSVQATTAVYGKCRARTSIEHLFRTYSLRDAITQSPFTYLCEVFYAYAKDAGEVRKIGTI